MEMQPMMRVPPELHAMICQSLAFKDLFNLARAYKAISDIATEALFRQDAATRNSSAILWAASASGVSVEYTDLAVSILRRSLQHGGNVNVLYHKGGAVCTAIHVAVAHGSTRFVEELVSHNAQTNDTYSLRLWTFLSVARCRKEWASAARLLDFAKSARLREKWWSLLLPAMFRREPQVASLLLNRNCSCYLALDRKYLFVPPLQEAPTIHTAYTIHHLLVEENLFPSFHETLFEKFRHAIALPGSISAMPPLMKAIEKGNEAAAALLLTFPQNLDAVSSLGWPMLSYAVEGAATLLTVRMRDWAASMVRRLLEEGAGANVGGPSSPLQLAVTSLLDGRIITDTKHMKRMRNMIKDLLEFGADVNVITADGHSLSQYVFLEMQKEKDLTLLRSLFVEFLENGMHINDVFIDGNSMIAKAIIATSGIGKTLITKLLDHGARPGPHEYDDFLRLWLNKDKTFPKQMEGNLESLAPEFSQAAIDRAFTQIVRRKDVKQFDTLKQWRKTSKPSSLLAEALGNRFARLPELYTLPFDPNWQSSSGQSYAHRIIEAVDNEIYNERQAMDEMQRLLAKGVSLGRRDFDGKVVLQRLTAVQKTFTGEDPFGKLERLLMHARLEEQDDEI